MFKSFISNFDGGVASHVLAGRVAGRHIGSFLDKLGKEVVSGCITQNFLVLDIIPADYKEGLKTQAKEYLQLLPAFKDIEVYNWIPQNHRSFIESHPNGKQWGILQVQQIRIYLLS